MMDLGPRRALRLTMDGDETQPRHHLSNRLHERERRRAPRPRTDGMVCQVRGRHDEEEQGPRDQHESIVEPARPADRKRERSQYAQHDAGENRHLGQREREPAKRRRFFQPPLDPIAREEARHSSLPHPPPPPPLPPYLVP